MMSLLLHINILLIFLVPFMLMVLLIANQSDRFINDDDAESYYDYSINENVGNINNGSQNDLNYHLRNDQNLIGLRNHCNFLDDIRMNDENSFAYSSIDLELEKILILIRHGDRGPLKNVHDLQSIPCNQSYLYDENKLIDNRRFHISRLLDNFLDESDHYYNQIFNENIPKTSDGCAPGLLTKFGISQLIKLGLLISKNYRLKLNFRNDTITLDQISINTTPYPRTIQSALAFLYGLLSATNGHHSNQSFVIDSLRELAKKFKEYSNVYFCDYDHGDNKDDNGINNGTSDKINQKYCFINCTEMDDLTNSVYTSINSDTSSEMNDLIERIEHVIKPVNSVKNIGTYKRSIISAFDTLNTYVCHQQTLPCSSESNEIDDNKCIRIDDLKKIDKFINNLGRKLQLSDDQLRLSWMQSYGFLLNIIEQIKLRSSNDEKLILFSGHDLTIHSLSTVLGFVETTLPQYASRIIFEVYRLKSVNIYNDNNEQFIRIIYNGNDVTRLFPLCRLIIDDNGDDDNKLFDSTSTADNNGDNNIDESPCIKFDQNQQILLIKLSSFEQFIHENFVEKYQFKNC